MSRTDAHTPLWVRLSREELPAKAHHSSDHAQCSLSVHPRDQYVDGTSSWNLRTDCHWTYKWVGISICSCRMCHAGPQRRAENRLARHRDREALHVALGRWRAGDADAFDELWARSRVHEW